MKITINNPEQHELCVVGSGGKMIHVRGTESATNLPTTRRNPKCGAAKRSRNAYVIEISAASAEKMINKENSTFKVCPTCAKYLTIEE